MFGVIQKKYTKNNKPSHNSINTMIVPVVIGNPMLSCLLSIISYWFCQIPFILAKLLGYLPPSPWQSLPAVVFLSDSRPAFFSFLA